MFRTKQGEYPEYHTSLDNFKVVTLKGVMGGYKVAKEAIKLLLKKIIPKNKILCEPQMGKRGLYPTLSTKNKKTISRNYMDFLQYADGKSSLERISKKINLDFFLKRKIFYKLKSKKLVY